MIKYKKLKLGDILQKGDRFNSTTSSFKASIDLSTVDTGISVYGYKIDSLLVSEYNFYRPIKKKNIG